MTSSYHQHSRDSTPENDHYYINQSLCSRFSFHKYTDTARKSSKHIPFLLFPSSYTTLHGVLQSMGLQGVGHNWGTSLCFCRWIPVCVRSWEIAQIHIFESIRLSLEREHHVRSPPLIHTHTCHPSCGAGHLEWSGATLCGGSGCDRLVLLSCSRPPWPRQVLAS